MRRSTATIAMSTALLAAAPVASADTAPVHPGMLIYQGHLSCTLGYVDPRSRIGVTAGHCFNGDGSVLDESGIDVGRKVVAHSNRPDVGPIYDTESAVDYEEIVFNDGLTLTDVLPNGNRLERDDSVTPVEGMAVCRTGSTTGEACGQITRVGKGWFRFDGPTIDKGDSGGPVYTSVGDRTVILGVIRGFMSNPTNDDVQSWAMTWPSIVAELRGDGVPLP